MYVPLFFIFIIDGGEIEVLVGHSVPLFLYGYGLTNDSEVIFTSAQGKKKTIIRVTPLVRTLC